jgi:predicted nucleic acid-binding protein
VGPVPEGTDAVRVVVCDTGPILHLHEAGGLALLAEAGEILIPPTVDDELSDLMTEWPASRPSWLRVRRLPSEDERRAAHLRGMGGLGLGEAEAIVLARSARADWLLTDDAGARIVAATLGLEVHGSLGVVLWAAAGKRVRRLEALAVLDGLAKSSLWISEAVLRDARQALDRLLPS